MDNATNSLESDNLPRWMLRIVFQMAEEALTFIRSHHPICLNHGTNSEFIYYETIHRLEGLMAIIPSTLSMHLWMKNGSCNRPSINDSMSKFQQGKFDILSITSMKYPGVKFPCPIFPFRIRMFSDRNFSKKNLPGLMRAAMSGV